ncbi:hypothetical protein GmHk_04G010626 [Glycine max]|nr:hypothetical protein GmHk_04G010626 [Glycine max]
MFIDYVSKTWIIPHKKKFITVWMNKVMHLGNTTTNKVESAHWDLKRCLGCHDNMITLQHTQIKTSFETNTHVVGHVFKKTLYKRLLGMVLRYALNEIVAEFERVHYAGKNPSACGCVMRTTHGLPCACELSRRLSFSDQGLCEAEVTIKEEIKTISKRFEELDLLSRVKLREITYPDQNSMCPPLSKVNTKGAPKKPMNRNQRSTKRDPSYWGYVDSFHYVQNKNSSVKHSASSSDLPKPTRIIPMLDQFEPFIAGFHGRMTISTSSVSVDKLMNITEMGYVIASRYNVILVSLSRQQSMTFFPLRSQPPPVSSVHHIIYVDHVFGNYFVQVKQWPTPYISRMQQYRNLMMLKRDYVDLNED